MLKIFVRQVLQLVPLQQLCWPSPDELRSVKSQHYIWERCFRTGETAFLPPERYRYAVLKALLRRVEDAIVDPEEDVSPTCYERYYDSSSVPVLIAVVLCRRSRMIS